VLGAAMCCGSLVMVMLSLRFPRSHGMVEICQYWKLTLVLNVVEWVDWSRSETDELA